MSEPRRQRPPSPAGCRPGRVEIRLRPGAGGGTAVVPAAGADPVRRLLSTSDLVFEPGREGAVAGRRVPGTLGREVDGEFCFPAKLALPVAAALWEAGVPVEVPDLLPALPPPDPAALAVLTGPAARLLGSAAARFGGLVAVGPGTGPEAVVPAILNCWPAARAVVAVPNRDRVREWVGRLRRAGLPQPVQTRHDLERGGWFRQPRALVTSLQLLGSCRPEDFDVAIVPDVRPLRGVAWPDPGGPFERGRSHLLLGDPAAAAFGFVRPDEGTSTAERLRLQALFGPVLGGRSDGGTSVRVAIVAPPRPSAWVPDPAADLVGWKKQAVWGNPARNAFIGRLAAGLADRDPAAVRAVGADALGLVAGPVVVLVEGAPHGRSLAPHLPGWPVVTARAAAPADPSPGVIVTESAARPAAAAVVVDARGAGPIDPGWLPPAGGLLVDLADPVPPAAAEKARRRLTAYRRRGWAVPTAAASLPRHGRGR